MEPDNLKPLVTHFYPFHVCRCVHYKFKSNQIVLFINDELSGTSYITNQWKLLYELWYPPNRVLDISSTVVNILVVSSNIPTNIKLIELY